VAQPVSVSVPLNAGVPGRPVSDSDTTQILDALRSALTSEIAVVDLEGGNAWWETRLLVLVAGAARLGCPATIVFVGMEEGVTGRFIGWAPSEALLPLLLRVDSRYKECYARARAAANQWELVEPPGPGQIPAPFPWMQGLAIQYQWMAFDPASNLPNRFAREQFFLADLGARIEMQGQAKPISVVRLRDLFGSVLRTSSLDETSPTDKQVEVMLAGEDQYLAVTQGRRYLRLVSRLDVQNSVLRSAVKAIQSEQPR
jgi:hypothetical protein